MKIKNYKKYAPALLRIALAMVFIWFSFSQFKNPAQWAGLVPSWIASIIQAKTVVYMNATFEILFGSLMLLGLFTRFTSFLLAVHLIGIAFGLGYGPIMIRDLGLALATFAVWLNGPDILCLERKEEELQE